MLDPACHVLRAMSNIGACRLKAKSPSLRALRHAMTGGTPSIPGQAALPMWTLIRMLPELYKIIA